MFLHPFFYITENGIMISPAQASAFAKIIAGDFNPIHDEGAKRFCVPGDLLFSLMLKKYGLYQQMQFSFEGMIGENVELVLAKVDQELAVQDLKEKRYLKVNTQGHTSHNEAQIESFIRSYTAFSALNFTHILVPLMKQHGVMINPERPLVIYDGMGFQLSHLDFDDVELQLVKQQLTIDGKRGDVELSFILYSNGKQIGTGQKKLILSGLRPLEDEKLQILVDKYEDRRLTFTIENT